MEKLQSIFLRMQFLHFKLKRSFWKESDFFDKSMSRTDCQKGRVISDTIEEVYWGNQTLIVIRKTNLKATFSGF